MTKTPDALTTVCLGGCSGEEKPTLSFKSIKDLIRGVRRLLERAGILQHDHIRDLSLILDGTRMEKYRAAKHVHLMQKGKPDSGYRMPMPRHPYNK